MKKLDNKGASLVLALVAILFVTLLASTVMAAAMANLTLKRMEFQSKRSFYTAETAIDEIYAGLGKLSMNSMNDAYVQELSVLVDDSGSVKDNAAANKDMKHRFVVSCLNELSNHSATLDANGIYHGTLSNLAVKTILESYISEPSKLHVNQISKIRACANESDGYRITIYDVSISYESSAGYFADITTDFVISYPDIDVSFHNNNPKDFLDYCLVADTNVAFGNDIATALVNVGAGIFAGKDFNVNNGSNGTISSGKTVVHGDVALLSGAAAPSNLRLSNVTFWTEGDIRLEEKTSGTGADFVSEDTVNLYVQDDLEFNKDGCSADIAGNYYGYGSAPGNAAAANASIILNAKSGTLNIHANDFNLLGHAWVDVNNGITLADSYETGESVSVKKAQEIYLVLDEYLKNDTRDVTNPIGAGKVPTPDANGNYDTLIDYNKIKNFFAYDLLNATNPVILVTDSVKSASYFYWHFKSQEALEIYTQAVVTGIYNGADIQSNASWQSEHRVYQKSATSAASISVSAANPQILGNYMYAGNQLSAGNMDAVAADTQSRAIRSLLKTTYGLMADKTVFEKIVNTDMVTKTGAVDFTYSAPGGDWHLRVVTADNYDVPSGDANGIILHAGSGIVNMPHDYNGLIVSKGTIAVTADATITSVRSELEEVIEANAEFAKYFKAYYTPPSGTESSIDNLEAEDFVNIANWRKQ